MKSEEFLKEVCDLIDHKLSYFQASEIGDGIEEKKLTRKDKERQKILDFVQQVLSRSQDIKDEAFLDENEEYATNYPIVSDQFTDYVYDRISGRKWLSTSQKFAEVIKVRNWYNKTNITKESAYYFKKQFAAGKLSEEMQADILKKIGYECREREWK